MEQESRGGALARPGWVFPRWQLRYVWPLFLVWCAAFFYWEVLYQALLYAPFAAQRLLWLGGAALARAALATCACGLLRGRGNYRLALVLAVALCLLYMVQFGYCRMFKTPLLLFSLLRATQVLEFGAEIRTLIWHNLGWFALFLLPLAAFFPLRKRYWPRHGWALRCSSLGVAALLLALSVYVLLPAGGRQPGSAYALYHDDYVPELAQRELGMLTALTLELRQSAAGLLPRRGPAMASAQNVAPAIASDAERQALKAIQQQQQAQQEQTQLPYNMLDIDFYNLAQTEQNALLRDMHGYFGMQTPTRQNEYSGLLAGCNLIFITAEAFSHYLLDYDIFPTLRRMATEGFTFSNFYTPSWSVSTSDGEYVACTGLLPKTGIWSFARSAENYLPFALGHQFAALGYAPPLAFHNHSYSFYERHLSHPNLGYQYYGVGNGLQVDEEWPESDLQMMQWSLPQYIDEARFHVYYMTVSGHLQYNFGGNQQAVKHEQEVAHLPLSAEARAYLACNLELEAALRYLVAELEAAGKLQDTVFVLSADHYPYGLSEASLAELNGGTLPERNFELYRNALIIWKPGLPQREITAPASSLDILPTLSNLFGLPYDARLLPGRDIFSDSEPLVLFNNRSWINAAGSYNSLSGEVTGGLDEATVQRINQIVRDKFHFSTLILEQDYYRAVLPNLRDEQ